jgi:hypothetical protein
MSMTYDEARADAARIIAEHDALYGSPEQWQARELHQRARQLRKAERAKQQKQADARVAKHHQMLAAREAERQQPQPRTKEEWSKALTAFNSANPGWLAWWNDCLKMAYGDGAVEMAAFKSETLSIEEFKAKEEAVRTPSGHLFLLLSQLNHHLRTEIC